MKKLAPSLALALLLAGASPPALAATPAPTPAAGGVSGVAFVNLDAVIANSTAYKTAQTQRQTTYKAQIDQYNARAQQIEAQLKPLREKIQKDQTTGVTRAVLEQDVGSYQQIQESAKQDLDKIIDPEQRSEAYGLEQIKAQLAPALQAAMQKNGILLLLRAEAIIPLGTPAADLTQQVINEVNVLLPSIQIVPPAGWQPADVRAQQAQQAGARGTGTDSGR